MQRRSSFSILLCAIHPLRQRLRLFKWRGFFAITQHLLRLHGDIGCRAARHGKDLEFSVLVTAKLLPKRNKNLTPFAPPLWVFRKMLNQTVWGQRSGQSTFDLSLSLKKNYDQKTSFAPQAKKNIKISFVWQNIVVMLFGAPLE